MNLKKILIYLIFLLPSLSFADDWTGFGKFTELQCISTNSALAVKCAIVGFNGTASDRTINYCGKPWGTLYLPAESEQNSDRIYSTLLSALMSDKQVKIYTYGCDEGYPRIGGVQIKK